jgi:hypothetical protein
MTEFKMMKELAQKLQARFGGAPAIDVVNHCVVYRDSVITVQLCSSKFDECLWTVDTPGGYETFRRSLEVEEVLASIYSYSLV